MATSAKKSFKAIRSVSLNLDDELSTESTDNVTSNTYTLKSGRRVQFKYQQIASEKVATHTYVDEGNIRIPEELTKESLKIIVDSIKDQQFYPAIAQKNNDKYSILDGSRRRQAAIYAGVGLDILSCEETLSSSEVKELIKQLQTAEKFSPRDQGKHFTKLMNSGLTIDEVANIEGVSKSHISKCNKAWSIPAELIALFPIPLAITQAQFTALSKVAKSLSGSQSIKEFSDKVEKINGASNDDVLKSIEQASEVKSNSGLAKAVKIVDINPKQWVKSKVIGHKQTIELSRIDEEDRQKIESYIVELLNNKK